MADPLIAPGLIDIVEKVGVTLATILGLVYVLRWLSQMHLKALNERITTLERVVKERDAIIARREEKIDSQQREHMATVISNAQDMKALVVQLLANDKANRDFMREHQQVVVGMFDRLGMRPCMIDNFAPHPAPPVAPPAVPATRQHRTPRPDLPEVPGSDRISR
jgi:hypothetical protein